MRIIYLHQYFVTPQMVGGARSYEMAKRLVASGHEVHMVTSDQEGSGADGMWRESIEAGIHVHWVSVPYDNTMGFARRMRAFCSFAWRAAVRATTLKGDVIFATSTPLTIAIPGVYAAWRARVPMVFEVRDLWPAVPIAIGAIRNPVLKLLARWLELFAYRNASRIVALAPGMRDEIVASGYPHERVTVIPNGCDLATFADSAGAARLRAKNPWLGSRRLLVFTGTFGLVNGMDYLVKLAAELARIDREIRIVAVGTGREFERTRRLAIEAKVLDENLFLLGKLPKHEAVLWTQTADMNLAMFTGPDIVWRDAVQNKFFDSLAAGRPVASNFRGFQSIVAVEAGAGLILSPSDAGEAARVVATALSDPDWLKAAGKAARRLAESRFNRDDLADQLEGVLEAAVRQRGLS